MEPDAKCKKIKMNVISTTVLVILLIDNMIPDILVLQEHPKDQATKDYY